MTFVHYIIACLHIRKALDLLTPGFLSSAPFFPVAAEDVTFPDPRFLFVRKLHTRRKGPLPDHYLVFQFFTQEKFPQVFLPLRTAADDGHIKLSPHIAVQLTLQQIHPPVKGRRLPAVDIDQLRQKRSILDGSRKRRKNIARLFIQPKIILLS